MKPKTQFKMLGVVQLISAVWTEPYACALRLKATLEFASGVNGSSLPGYAMLMSPN